MTKNIFLTGAKGVGKSTICRFAAEASGRELSGFYTVKTDKVFDGRFSVHMLGASKPAALESSNLLFFCDENEDVRARSCAAFNSLGAEIISKSLDAANAQGSLIIMDELGPAEAAADRFIKEVQRALDSSVPVLGVLQQGDYPLYHEIEKRPDCEIITVTKSNRSQLKEKAAGIFATPGH